MAGVIECADSAEFASPTILVVHLVGKFVAPNVFAENAFGYSSDRYALRPKEIIAGNMSLCSPLASSGSPLFS